jgi:hypothetical protein
MPPTPPQPNHRRHHRPARSRIAAVALATVLASVAIAACSPDADVQRADETSGAADEAVTPTQVVDGVTLPVEICAMLPDDTDSLDFTGAQFSAVPNGVQTGLALAYAVAFPYYVGIWARARHESWLIVGVSGGMRELQADLDAQFPGARVLAINVDWNEQQLGNLSGEVQAALAEADGAAVVSWSAAVGRVIVDLTNVDDDIAEALEPYAEMPVCVNLPG